MAFDARWRNLLILLVLLLAFALRIHDLRGENYWLDEHSSLRRAQEGLAAIPVEPEGRRSPLFVLLSHVWVNVFGVDEMATRTLSVLFGFLAVPALYRMGKEILGWRVGLIGMLLMALAEFQIVYAQDFRFYSLFVLLTLLSSLAYVRFRKTQRGSTLVMYVLVSVLLFYTHPYGLFVIVVHNLHGLLCWPSGHRRGVWLVAQAVGLALILPGLRADALEALRSEADVMDWIASPSWWTPALTLYKFVLPGRHLPVLLTVLVAAGLAAVGLLRVVRAQGLEGWAASARRLVRGLSRLPQRVDPIWLLVLWLGVPILIPLMLSYVFGPMYAHRYVISAAPAVYLLLAVLVWKLRRVASPGLLLLAYVVLIAPGLQEYYVTDVNEQWQEAADYIEANSRETDVILFAPAEGVALLDNFALYYHGKLRLCGIQFQPDDTHLKDAVADCIGDERRAWVILRGADNYIESFDRFFLEEESLSGLELLNTRTLTGLHLYLFSVHAESIANDRERCLYPRETLCMMK